MTNATRDCEHCGSDFIPKTKRSRFCNRKCADAAYYAANKAKHLERCSAYYARNSERIKTSAMENHQANRARRIAQMTDYRANNLDKERDRRLRNSDKIQAQKREWNTANAELIREHRRMYRARNAETLREYNKKWTSENLEQFRIYNHNRRARLLAASLVPFTPAQLAARMEAFGGLCWMCGDDGPTMDHVKPLILGGPHILANIRPACQSCNSSKGSRWFGAASVDQFRRGSLYG